MFHGWFSETQKQISKNFTFDEGSVIWLDSFGNEIEVTVVLNSNEIPNWFNDFIYKGIVINCINPHPKNIINSIVNKYDFSI